MDKIYLKENNETVKFVAVDSKSTKCTCYNCGQCAWCIIFVPAVGVGIALALGVALTTEKSPN